MPYFWLIQGLSNFARHDHYIPKTAKGKGPAAVTPEKPAPIKSRKRVEFFQIPVTPPDSPASTTSSADTQPVLAALDVLSKQNAGLLEQIQFLREEVKQANQRAEEAEKRAKDDVAKADQRADKAQLQAETATRSLTQLITLMSQQQGSTQEAVASTPSPK